MWIQKGIGDKKYYRKNVFVALTKSIIAQIFPQFVCIITKNGLTE
jgi:hypothetical protein